MTKWKGVKERLYDVVAVDLETSKVRFMAQGKTEKNAEAVVNMAVMRMVRRGVESEFFSEVPAGKYKEGDTWKGTAYENQ